MAADPFPPDSPLTLLGIGGAALTAIGVLFKMLMAEMTGRRQDAQAEHERTLERERAAIEGHHQMADALKSQTELLKKTLEDRKS